MLSDEGYRRHVRLREDISVRWRIESSGLQGEGTIRNLSVSGMLLESQSLAMPPKDAEFTLEVVESENAPFTSCRAKFVWGRRALSEQRYYFCGLEFLDPPEKAVSAIEARLAGISNASNVGIVGHYLGLHD
jgi:hypothetical protein